MELKTILDAYRTALEDIFLYPYAIRYFPVGKRVRQARAFRARILRMDEEAHDYFIDGHGDPIVKGDSLIEKIKNLSSDYEEMLDEQDKEIAEKDAVIAELLQLQTKEAILRDGEYWFNREQPKKELHGGRK